MMNKESFSSTESFPLEEPTKQMFAVSTTARRSDIVVYGTVEEVQLDFPDAEITPLGIAWRYTL